MDEVNELPILTRASLLGEQGMDAVKALAPRLGFYFRDATKGDYGIDAQFELFEPTADPTKYQMTGRLIAVQIKCGETIAQSSTDAWRIYCSAANVNYWWRHSLPVILIYCDPSTNSCYWVQIDDRSTRPTRLSWVVTIPKTNKLDNARVALTSLASGEPTVAPRTFPQMFTLPFDEQKGLQIADDEELGMMCAEIVAASFGSREPKIAVDIPTELWVLAKLDELEAKPTLSMAERQQRVMLDEIDRRYQRKKADIAASILLMLTHPRIGKAYFGGQGDVVQGKALRRLIDSFTMPPLREPRALMIDVFPSIARPDPVIHLSLDENEKQALIEQAGITDLHVQLVAYWGYRALDLPREVFVTKLLPLTSKALLALVRCRDQSVDELLEEIGVPIESWTIGRS